MPKLGYVCGASPRYRHSGKYFVELRQSFPSADQVGNLTAFNIGGNKYRLVTHLNYSRQKIYIRAILTHAKYNQEDWKDDPWFKK